MVPRVIEDSKKHHDWEEFSREKLLQGVQLQRYYPLHDDARAEYEAWRSAKRQHNQPAYGSPARLDQSFVHLERCNFKPGW